MGRSVWSIVTYFIGLTHAFLCRDHWSCHSVICPGLRDFVLDLSPSEVVASPVLIEVWQDAFNCSLIETADHKRV
ncbi:hypothetical protein ILYODFUR_029132 [Ilyodon furcidens]|uniref:Secreted protein n=1 Tax=Ilyodon furcidens TaxID=33524 RepID=A0ABV0TNT5_9TELE